MKQATLEKLAIVLAAGVIVSAVWFYVIQIGDVIEMLEMAYG